MNRGNNRGWLMAAGMGLLALGAMLPGCNPFAPGLDNTPIDRNALFGDRRHVDGLFRYFRNSYESRDSLLYGRMIDPQFRFVWFDFTNNNTVFWGRDQEMIATYRMFRAVKQVNLVWNNYVFADTLGSDTAAAVERYFNLTIVQDEQNIFRGTGSALLQLRRASPTSEWQIREWQDKSDF